MTEHPPIISESDEHAHLARVRDRIRAELDRVENLVDHQMKEMVDLKKYLSESKSDMDHVEKVSVRQSVDQMGAVGEHSASGLRKLRKLLGATYFGRIDFQEDGTSLARPVYLGIHSFHDPENGQHLVHDWRAPIASMFYDFETGPAAFDAPAGRISGSITRKRQYRVEDGKLVYFLESSVSIHDDVLQAELSRASSEKMKSIVATIQRDQNAIIRNDVSPVLVIQGAAGSGKTSIALHRIAFLLYRFKETISSDDILIISPNKVFAHYISNVLPELGEENIKEMTMETLASRLLGPAWEFQSFYEQVAGLFVARNEAFCRRIQFKASPAFLQRLDEYILHVKNTNFRPSPVLVGRFTIAEEFLRQRYYRLGRLPFAARVNELVEAIIGEVERGRGREVNAKERAEIRKQLKGMFGSMNTDALYKAFFEWVEEPGLFKRAGKGRYEYCDVFPLIYFKLQLEGVAAVPQVKHLVIDEMQDYTPVQYAVLSQLFPCKKTILGDANQSVNPLSSSTAATIKEMLSGAECVFMHRSYRSTIEISNLAQHIQRNEDLIPIERHGEMPALMRCANRAEELQRVHDTVRGFLASDFKTLGIVCKTQEDARAVFEAVRDLSPRISLVDPTTSFFGDGVTISTAHLAKGLEFDQVILPFCDDRTYSAVVDRHMLYVGCTRAMHKLSLTFSGKLSRFLERAPVALASTQSGEPVPV